LATPENPDAPTCEASEPERADRTPRLPSPRSLLLGLAGYSGAALLTLIATRSLFSSDPPFLDWGTAAGLVLLVALWTLQRRFRRPGLAVALLWTGLALLFIANTLAEWRKPHYYGDSDLVSLFIVTQRVIPKWLAGTSLLGDLWAGLWMAPWFREWLPLTLRQPFHVVASWGTLSVWAGAVALSLRRPERLAVVLPLFGTLYIAFGAGYLEYYPFIAPLYLASLAYLFLEPLEGRSPIALGLLAGALPTLYIGFIPLAVLVLVFGALAHPRRILQLGGSALLTYGLLVRILWRGPLTEYFQLLRGALDMAATNKIFERYAGRLAQPDDTFFPVTYALSPEHLGDVAYVALHSGLLLPLLLLGWALYRGRRRIAGRLGLDAVRKDLRLGLAAAFAAQQIHFLFFMVPVYGPRRDIDLFFSAVLAASFCAGFVWDWLLTGEEQRAASQQRFLLISLTLGHSAVTLGTLLLHGLPAID